MSLITTVSEVGQSRGVLTKRGKGDATAATAEISEGPKDGSIVTSTVFLSPFFSFPLFFFFYFHRSFDETGIRAGGEEILKITLVGVLSLIVKVT